MRIAIFLGVLASHNIISVAQALDSLFTVGIVFFAAIQGYSMVSQEELQRTRFKIDDLRNELEKAYGPLYSLLNKGSSPSSVVGPAGKDVEISSEEKIKLKEIMTTYPFMFSKDIFDMWQNTIRKDIDSDIRTGFRDPQHAIPEDFKNKIIEEYNRKVKENQDLVGRENREVGQGSQPQNKPPAIGVDSEMRSRDDHLSQKDVFTVLSGVALRLVAGLIGAMYSTMYFDVILKGDTSLSLYFWTWLIALIIVVAILLGVAFLAYKRMRPSQH